MNKTIVNLLALTLVCCHSISAAEEPVWNSIKVEVLADHPVDTLQKLSKVENGFQRLAITLSNPGKDTLKLRRITIRIPLVDQVTNDSEVVHGSSCMGRTPMLRQSVGKQTAKSSSHFYSLIRSTKGKYLFAGSLSWRIFLPNFTVSSEAFEIWSDGDSRELKPGESIQYESIVLARSGDWFSLLSQFGKAIASENGITKLKPADFKGWATWDYYGSKFSADDIYANMDQLNKLSPGCNLIQIDGGWWTKRGDYMSVRPDLLPGGIKAINDRIISEGKVAGLHLDGFRADISSEIYKQHPEYFLHDQDGRIISLAREPSDDSPADIYFDYSHPGARQHIADCIHNMKKNWGVRYFKVDFMRYGLKDDILGNKQKSKTIKAYDPTITGVERFRLGMKAMRDAIGSDAYFLGCSAVFGPCIGFVDGMRTGGDIFPRYESFPERSLANLGNFYLSGHVFNGDIDYLTFREAVDEDDKVSKSKNKSGGKMALNEAQMWADLNKLYGTARLHSDNLITLRPERQALVKELLQFPPMDETIPLDLWEHGSEKNDGFERVLSRKGDDIYLGIFNWSDAAKEYSITEFGKIGPLKLEGRHSVVLKYDGMDSFAKLYQKLQP